jgi:hypothetical protein
LLEKISQISYLSFAKRGQKPVGCGYLLALDFLLQDVAPKRLPKVLIEKIRSLQQNIIDISKPDYYSNPNILVPIKEMNQG